MYMATNFLDDALASFATSLGSNAGKAVVDDGEKLKQQLVNEVKQRHIDWKTINLYLDQYATDDELAVFHQQVREKMQYLVPFIEKDVANQCYRYTDSHIGMKHSGSFFYDDTDLMTMLTLNDQASKRIVMMMKDGATKLILSTFSKGNPTKIIALKASNMIKLYYGQAALAIS